VSSFQCSSAQTDLESWIDTKHCEREAIDKLLLNTNLKPPQCTVCAVGQQSKFCIQIRGNSANKAGPDGVPLKFATSTYQCASDCTASGTQSKREEKKKMPSSAGGNIAAVIARGGDFAQASPNTGNKSPTACMLSFVHDTRKIPLAKVPAEESTADLGEEELRLRFQRRLQLRRQIDISQQEKTAYIGVEFVKVDVCKGGYNYGTAKPSVDNAEELEHLELIGETATMSTRSKAKKKGKTNYEDGTRGVLKGMHKSSEAGAAEKASQAAFASFRKDNKMATDSMGFSNMKCVVQKIVLRTYICLEDACDESGSMNTQTPIGIRKSVRTARRATTAAMTTSRRQRAAGHSADANFADLGESQFFTGAAVSRRRNVDNDQSHDQQNEENSQKLGERQRQHDAEHEHHGKAKGKLRKQLADAFGGETSTLAAMVV
jgi:hypothetical protein